MPRHTFSMLSLLAGLFAAWQVAAAPLPGQIVVDSGNPAWLRYSGGGPFFLASPGDPEGFLYRGSMNGDGTRNGDQSDIIQKLAGTGANGIYFQIIRSHGGDGNDTHNPFNNNDPSSGLNQAVLDQWHSWFTAMDSAGITIFLFFYDDSARIWNTGDSVGSAEESFFRAIVNEFEDYKHLIWVMGEEYAEMYSAARISALAQIVRNADDRNHPIAVHKNSGLDFDEFANDPNIDQFAIQYNKDSISEFNSGMNSAWTDANGRYNLNMSEAANWGSGSTSRQKAWAVAMGGAYVMAYEMDIASTPISELNDLGRLRQFMESTEFQSMRPQNGLAAADTDYVLADEARGYYIAYGAGSVSSLGLDRLDPGSYSLRWLDAADGRTVTQQVTVSGSGEFSRSKPSGFGSEVALYISPGNPAPTPNPPEDLVVE